MSDDVLKDLLAELEALFLPLTEAAESPDRLFALLRRLGWTLRAAVPDPAALSDVLGGVGTAIQNLKAVANGGDPDFGRLLDALSATGEIPGVVRGLVDSFSHLSTDATTALAGLPVELLEMLFIDWIEAKSPLTHAILRAGGLIELEHSAAILGGGDVPLREEVLLPRLHFDRLPDWLTDPAGQTKARFGMDGVTDEATAADYAARVFPLFGLIAQHLGGQGIMGRPYGAASRLSAEDELRLAQMLTLSWTLPALDPVFGAAARSRVGAVLAIEAAAGAKPAELYVKPFGEAAIAVSGGGWTGALSAMTDFEALIFSKDGVTLPGIATGDFSARLGVSRPASGRAYGSAKGTRFEPGALRFGANVDLSPQGEDYGLALDINGAALILAAGDGDGFLAKVLPRDGIVAPLDLGLVWSKSGGFAFKGAAGLSATIDIKRDVGGILKLDTLWFSIGATAENGPPKLGLEAALTGGVSIGPVAATIDRVGLRLDAAFPSGGGNAGPIDLALGFLPPRRISFKIAAGPVKGSGFLAFETAQYSGAIQLSVNVLGLTALGVINTRFPDGRTGYSLVVIITADFPAIPLGFGFSLNGVGGLVGINRRMDLEAIKLRVAEGALGSILFPRDPASRMNAVLADIAAIFPVAEGRHVFGPMVRLTWGPKALLTIEVAVLLDLPAPLRLAILGRMRLILPDIDNAIADIRLDVAGLIDFGQETAIVAASLIDSRIAAFTITGDMAMVLSWGATKTFALSMGGFYPGFPVPEGMPPSMRRLAIALSTGENPRFRLESYFAVTANTVQFGARAELYAAADLALGTIAVVGELSLDAFLQFDPFRLEVALRAFLGILRNGKPLLSAELQAHLTGPAPWRLVGFAAFEVVVQWRIPLDVTFGEPQAQETVTVDLEELLTKAVSRIDSWSSLPPREAGRIVALREREGASLLHPLGGIEMVQRLLPFGKVIKRFGAARPTRGTPIFDLTGFKIGGAPVAFSPRQTDFAPGQFDTLTDDEKMSRPDFEAMKAGAGADFDSLQGSLAEGGWAADYEDLLLAEAAQPAPLQGAAGHLSLRQDERLGAGMMPEAEIIALRPERFVLADVASLEASWPLIATSQAEAADRLRALPESERGSRVIVNAADCWVMP
ncbi:MAG: DUF6603 domain-containing protein [Azonexus sp.]